MPLKRKRPADAHALVDNLLTSIDEFLAARDRHDDEERGVASPDRELQPEGDPDTGATRGADPSAL
jgi:hypothetical protein